MDDALDPDHDAKKVLRAGALAARRARSDGEIAAAREAIAAHVLDRAVRLGWRRVAGYEPLRTEPGSQGLLRGLAGAGIEVIVPITLPDHDLDWRRWRADGTAPGSGGSGAGGSGAGGPGAGGPGAGGPDTLGPEAVADVDAVLVPALAVARDGTRLGRGGGSYDRALVRVGTGATVAALLYDDELVDALPAEGWDRPVTVVVTPAGWRECGSSPRRSTD